MLERIKLAFQAAKQAFTGLPGTRTVEECQRAYNAAISYSLKDYSEGQTFLKCWNEGDWRAIAMEWPDFDLNTTGDPIAMGMHQRLQDEKDAWVAARKARD